MQRNRLTIRPVNMKDWDAEVERIKYIYNSAWEKNWGFVPMTDGEIEHLANGLKQVLDPRLVLMCERDGEPAGFSLSVPNVNEVLGRVRPGPSRLSSYLGAGRMILGKRNVEWFRVIALGVLEDLRGKGVGAMLYYHTAYAAYEAGYVYAEGSWILETNDDMNRALQIFSPELYKKYRIYQRSLG
jgi:GNAT superfamily N-acetyltransferase